MSWYEFKRAEVLVNMKFPFHSIIFAAMMQADEINLKYLKAMFPGVFREMIARQNTPDGALHNEEEMV